MSDPRAGGAPGDPCPVCGGEEALTLATAAGERAYCPHCFHGWRLDHPPYAYSTTAMCALGTHIDRLSSQIEFFAPFVPLEARVLEIGCATGELAAATRARLTIARYEGIELSPAGDKARRHLDRLHVQPLRALVEQGQIKPPFDIILMSHVLEHLADPAAELAAMRNVLAPGGALFLEVPNAGGHRRLPIDDNRTHLHFFCAASLTRLLARLGLETIAAATDARLDARYADSLRVIARVFHSPPPAPKLLSDHPALAGEDRLVVWGAGSLVDELLANYFDPGRIDFFIDRDPAKIGSQRLGRPVRSPDALGGEVRTVLINSIDFAAEIAADIVAAAGGVGHRLVPIGDLLDDPGPAPAPTPPASRTT